MGTLQSRARRIGAELTWQRAPSAMTLSLLLPRAKPAS